MPLFTPPFGPSPTNSSFILTTSTSVPTTPLAVAEDVEDRNARAAGNTRNTKPYQATSASSVHDTANPAQPTSTATVTATAPHAQGIYSGPSAGSHGTLIPSSLSTASTRSAKASSHL